MFWSIVICAYFEYVGQTEKSFLGFSVRYHLYKRRMGGEGGGGGKRLGERVRWEKGEKEDEREEGGRGVESGRK